MCCSLLVVFPGMPTDECVCSFFWHRAQGPALGDSYEGYYGGAQRGMIDPE